MAWQKQLALDVAAFEKEAGQVAKWWVQLAEKETTVSDRLVRWGHPCKRNIT